MTPKLPSLSAEPGAYLPRLTALPERRSPNAHFPSTPGQRNQLLHAVRRYVAQFNLVPPLSITDLKAHAARIIVDLQCPPDFADYVGVLLNNEAWREQLAAVPYQRRLLLLPKCLRVEAKCPATFDEFGLLCKHCGRCSIHDLTAEAEKLGYAVLVAEGSAVVMNLIQTGRIDAVIGVSCLGVLERAFPYMEAAAVPGVAIPLLQDDCHDTNVDLDWVWDYIHLTADDQTRRLDLSHLRGEIEGWFTARHLETLLGPCDGATEQLARDWLMRAGKRWRPFLTVATYHALAPNVCEISLDLQRVAVAVECFHKASLIHDDIEDGDEQRYGESTLHMEHGIPVALNVGDFLIGEGYRLLAASALPANTRAAMSAVAAAGQRELCRGQGAELLWASDPQPLSSLQILDVFRRKTSPAFEVALRLGALYAGQDNECAPVLEAYSRALGIAYQIRDDLEDLPSNSANNDIDGRRPSLLLAVAHECAQGGDREFLDKLWRREAASDGPRVESLCRQLRADVRCRQLLETYKEEAVRSLAGLENPSLKGLLRRVVGKIFNEIQIQGWCKEQEQTNRARRAAIPATA